MVPGNYRYHRRLRKVPLLFLLFFFCRIPCAAGQVPAGSRSRQPEYFQWLKSRQDQQDFSRLVLRNDLKVLIAESHETPLAVIGLYAAAPGSSSREREAVIGEMAMRLLFSGSPKRPAAQLSDQLWASSHFWWVENRPESVLLWMVCDPNELSRNLEAYAEMILGSVWDDASLQKAWAGFRYQSERMFRIQASGSDLASSCLFSWWDTPSFSDWAKRYEALPLQEVSAWRARYLRTDNLTLLLYGDFSAETISRELVRRFKELPKPAAGVSPAAEARSGKPGPKAVPVMEQKFSYTFLPGEVNRAVLQVRYPLPPEDHADSPALRSLAQLLASGPGSWLHDQLMDGKKAALALKMERVSYPACPGWLLFQAESAPGDLDALEIEFFSSLERLHKSEILDPALARANAQAQMEFYSRLETAWQRATHLLHLELGSTAKSWWFVPEKIRQVKAEDLKQVARLYLDFDRAQVREILPSSMGSRKYNAASFRQTMQAITSLVTESSLQVTRSRNEEQLVDPAWKPKSKNAPIAQPGNPERTSILRGPELEVWENPSLPIVDIGMYFPGGIDLEGGEKSGLTRLLLGCLMHADPASVLGQELLLIGLRGGRMEIVFEKEYFGYRLRVPPDLAWKSLDMLRHLLNNRSFREEDVAAEWKRLQNQAAARLDHPVARWASVFDSQVFGPHPYGRLGYPDLQGKAEWKLSQVIDWHGQLIESKLPLVIVVGDINGTELAGYFVKHFSSSRFVQRKIEWPGTTPPKESKTVDLSGGQGVRDRVYLMLGPEGENEETWLILVARELLEKETGRGTIPPAWGEPGHLLAGITSFRKGSRMVFHAPVWVEAYAQGGSGLLNWIRQLPGAIRENDWEYAKGRMVQRIFLETQKREGIMGYLARGYFVQQQFTVPSRLQAKLDSVSLGEFREVVERFWGQDKYIEVQW